MLRRLKNAFKRKRATNRHNPPPETQVYHRPPSDSSSEHLIPSEAVADVFDHGNPPPASRWSAPPLDNTSPASAPPPLYRDQCISLHRQVAGLNNELNRLAATCQRLEEDRDFAIGAENFHWDMYQRERHARDYLSDHNERLRARIRSIEGHRWRKDMRARVEEAELRASDAELELRRVRQQLDDCVRERRDLEDKLMKRQHENPREGSDVAETQSAAGGQSDSSSLDINPFLDPRYMDRWASG